MVKKNSKKKSAASGRKKAVPALVDLFGPPPVSEGEDAAIYEVMCKRFFEEVKPDGIIEEIWVRDIVYHTFRATKMRRQLVALLSANQYRGLKELLEPLCGYRSAGELAEGWAQGDAESIERVDDLLNGADFTFEMVQAQTLSAIIKDVERIQQLINNAEVNRNIVLREIEQRRVRLANALRETNEIVEGEFTEIAKAGLTSLPAAPLPAEEDTSVCGEEDATVDDREAGEEIQSVDDQDAGGYVEAAE